jgi:hypothetical protein
MMAGMLRLTKLHALALATALATIVFPVPYWRRMDPFHKANQLDIDVKCTSTPLLDIPEGRTAARLWPA